MKDLHCPKCGTQFVRIRSQSGIVERVLSRVKVFPFRCQLCMTQFRAFWSQSPDASHQFDRREYKRLRSSFLANVLTEYMNRLDNQVTDISMAGCRLETESPLPQGTFMELVIKPAFDEEAIIIDTAMVCSVRPESLGVRFLEVRPGEQRRLSQVVLNLLVCQSTYPSLYF